MKILYMTIVDEKANLPDESDSLWNDDSLTVPQHHCPVIVQHRTKQLHLTGVHLTIQLDDFHLPCCL